VPAYGSPVSRRTKNPRPVSRRGHRPFLRGCYYPSDLPDVSNCFDDRSARSRRLQ
jgi:hypothetical protein